MDLDSKDLGRLRRVADPRDVWTTEATDFTPWLAENIDVLADELGMTLTVIAMEVPVGEFRLDIQAADDDGHVVIIENQLERTDHSHLGQCLVYAAGLEAATVIWVSRLFRDEFRRAFDWLNERTDLGVQFFGVEVGVVQIGETGPRAPVFEVVSRPNDWQKGIKSGRPPGGPPQVSTPLNEARQSLFAEILEGVNAKRPAIRVPARNRDSWTTFASGPFGSWSIAQIHDGRVRVEAYLDCGDRDRNKTLFDEMAGDRANWESKVGFDLSFERLDDKRASRIAAHHPAVDLIAGMEPGERRQVVDWGVASLVTMIDTLNTHLRARAKELRSQVQPARFLGDEVDIADAAQ
jgi:Domain of unknown function (DUF4268)